MKTKKLIRLPRVFRNKWLKALESGRYRQTTGELLCNGKYCCLGVAGKVLRIHDNDLQGHCMPADLDLKNIKKYPTAIVRKPEENDSIENSEFASSLASMNDDGKTFKEIAAYIRSNTRGV